MIAYKKTKSASLLLTAFHCTSIHPPSTSKHPEDYQRFLSQSFHMYVITVISRYTEAFVGITGLYTKHTWKSHTIQVLIYLRPNFILLYKLNSNNTFRLRSKPRKGKLTKSISSIIQEQVNSNRQIGDQINKYGRIWKSSVLISRPFHTRAPQALQQDIFWDTWNLKVWTN